MRGNKGRVGRPPKDKREDLQNVTIALMATKADRDAIRKAATDRGMSVSAYLRDLAIGDGRASRAMMAADLFMIAERLETLADKAPAAIADELRAIVRSLDAAARRR